MRGMSVGGVYTEEERVVRYETVEGDLRSKAVLREGIGVVGFCRR